MNTLSIVVAQVNMWVGDISGNASRIIKYAQRAVDQHQADLVIFPELALTGYPPEDLLLRPELYDQCDEAVRFILANMPSTTLLFGQPAKLADTIYNQAVVLQPHHIISTYNKQQLPNYAVFDEARYFQAGHQPCIFTVKGIKIGVLICEDIWHQPTAQATSVAGADLITCINASPYRDDKALQRTAIVAQCARELNTPIIYANLVGGQDELVFDGGSMACDQTGSKVQQAAYFKSELMPVIVNKKNNDLHLKKYPLPKAPTHMELLHGALVLSTADYVHKNKFKGAIIGLSGGVDSALTLAIAVDALGPENVTAVMMPSMYTAEISLEDAAELAHNLQVTYQVIPINDLFTNFLSALQPIFNDSPADSTEENIQARIRGTLLMALSNKFSALVLATSNKSEVSVGYSTLYGDMVGGFAPIKDVAKTTVYELCEYINNQQPVIPKRIIMRPPSAELAPNQLDQDTLPDYPILDEILKRSIELDQDPATIEQAGFDPAIIRQVIHMVDRNEYKRSQAAVGTRVTARGFGKDRRYPISSQFLNQADLKTPADK